MTDQILLATYGAGLFALAYLGERLPFRFRQTCGYSSLALFGVTILSLFIPPVGEETLNVLNTGVKTIWEATK